MALNVHRVEFIKSAAGVAGFIRDDLPKIGFAGRSNVGKSSTINALLNRKNLARVSEVPGKTAVVNYFLIDGQLYLVDLPGYGYAKVAKERMGDWRVFMEDFFALADSSYSFVLLVDLRHAPTDDDRLMADYLRNTGRPFLVAANKADKLRPAQLGGQCSMIRSSLALSEQIPIIPYSAKTKSGIDALREQLFPR